MNNNTATNPYSSSTLAKIASNIIIASICQATYDVTYNAGDYQNLSTEQLIEVLNEANVPHFICLAGLVQVGYED